MQRMSIRIAIGNESRIVEVVKDGSDIYTSEPVSQRTLDSINALQSQLEFAPKERAYKSAAS
jgi:hypothetical protein